MSFENHWPRNLVVQLTKPEQRVLWTHLSLAFSFYSCFSLLGKMKGRGIWPLTRASHSFAHKERWQDCRQFLTWCSYCVLLQQSRPAASTITQPYPPDECWSIAMPLCSSQEAGSKETGWFQCPTDTWVPGKERTTSTHEVLYGLRVNSRTQGGGPALLLPNHSLKFEHVRHLGVRLCVHCAFIIRPHKCKI